MTATTTTTPRLTPQLAIVATEPSRGFACVRVVGELDRIGAARLRTQIAELREAGLVDVRLDLSAVTAWATGLGRGLAWMGTQLRGRGGNLAITGAPGPLLGELTSAVAMLRGLPTEHSDWPSGLIHRPETVEQP